MAYAPTQINKYYPEKSYSIGVNFMKEEKNV